MKAGDLNFSEGLNFDPGTGITTFKDSRLVLMNANSFGMLRQMLIDTMGVDRAKNILLKFGYKNGYSDFIQMKSNYKFDSEMELLASGPVIHTWQGIVHASPTKIQFDRDEGSFYFTGIWKNSYEAEQHLAHNQVSTEPVCWTLMGYASGWCTAFFGSPLVAIEPYCMGAGHHVCEWEIKPPKDWGDEGAPYIEAYKEFWE
ncbi:MAG: hypothetical protein SCALA702_15730 [Melioribacteraceae bacterium]|nr:MAG: hypothetical protein SCALA702_15730 [Melioribacteraceae bacterium]